MAPCSRTALCLLLLLATASARAQESRPESITDGQRPKGEATSALQIFERRILPIFRAAKPSSCTECHLSGVDLKDYIHPDQQRTFAALVRTGLVNVQDPERSKILEFIGREPEKPNLITQQVRRQEYEAFRAWIHAAVKDADLLAAKTAISLGPKVPLEVIRHTRQDRVLGSFVENIWSEVNRCVHCHSPEFNRGHIEKFGQEFVDQISWVVPGDAEATMQRVIDSGLIDPEEPSASLLLTKPTVQVEHRGGLKMLVGDRSYQQFKRFVDDYAAIVQEKYRSADQLPAAGDQVAVLSNVFLRIDNVPETYAGRVLHVELYPWDGHAERWSDECWASADWFANRNHFWQSPLHLTARRGSPRTAELASLQLPRGRYLAKLYVDRTASLKPKTPAKLSGYEPVGQVEIESEWVAGPNNRTVASFPTDR